MRNLFSLLVLLAFAVSCAHPITATSNDLGDTEGKACARNILFIIPLSLDNSIYTAAKDAEIKKISTVDATSFYSGIYNQTCTVVHGSK
jgi:TRL-like protein family